MAWRYPLVSRQTVVNVYSDIQRPSQYITFGLISATTLMVLCVLIRPDSLSVDYGLSYFGVFLSTLVPYTAAYMLYAFCIWKASLIQLEQVWRQRILAWLLRIMAVQIIGLLLTPYNRLYNIHVFFGIGLFSLQIILSLFMVAKWLAANWMNISLLLIEILAGLASLYYLPRAQGMLLQTQVVFQLAFAFLLIRGLGSWNRKP